MGKQHEVNLRALANRNSIEFMIVGGVALLVIMLFVSLRATEITVLEIALLTTAISAVILGFFKSQEPFYSFTLSECNLKYNHKYGSWQLKHENIKMVGVPSIANDFETLELNAVAIKLNNIDDFLLALSPRLACKLLIEQRHIFLQAVKIHCKNGTCPSEWLVEPSEFRSDSGQTYTGLIAMFANRMSNLHTLTGYHLLLPANVLDRDIWHFSSLLNRWKLNPEMVVQNLLKE